jgi:hypothetical protein
MGNFFIFIAYLIIVGSLGSIAKFLSDLLQVTRQIEQHLARKSGEAG